jgi:hypothetical protein
MPTAPNPPHRGCFRGADKVRGTTPATVHERGPAIRMVQWAAAAADAHQYDPRLASEVILLTRTKDLQGTPDGSRIVRLVESGSHHSGTPFQESGITCSGFGAGRRPAIVVPSTSGGQDRSTQQRRPWTPRDDEGFKSLGT